jgi:hypothetical protein
VTCRATRPPDPQTLVVDSNKLTGVRDCWQHGGTCCQIERARRAMQLRGLFKGCPGRHLDRVCALPTLRDHPKRHLGSCGPLQSHALRQQLWGTRRRPRRGDRLDS